MPSLDAFLYCQMFTFFKNLHWLPLSLFPPFLLLFFLSVSSAHMASIFMLIVFYQIPFTSITLLTSSSPLLIVLKCYLIPLISTHSLYISIHSSVYFQSLYISNLDTHLLDGQFGEIFTASNLLFFFISKLGVIIPTLWLW